MLEHTSKSTETSSSSVAVQSQELHQNEQAAGAFFEKAQQITPSMQEEGPVSNMNKNANPDNSTKKEPEKKEHYYFIHGTGSTPRVWKKYDGKVVDIISEEFGDEKRKDEIHLEKWNGANNTPMREEAIVTLVTKISSYHGANPGEPIILVGHSHGGNIALEVANRLSKKLPNENITLLTLNTPVRADYQPSYDDNVKHYNFFINNDEVQKEGGGFTVTGKVLNRNSGLSRILPGLPPKGFVARKVLVWLLNVMQDKFKNKFEVKIKIDESTFPGLGGETGPAKSQFECAVNIEVTSPIPEGEEKLLNKRLRHRIWHKKNLDEFKDAISVNKDVEDLALMKGRQEVEEIIGKFEGKTYKTEQGGIDQEAVKDAAAIKTGLSKNAQNFLWTTAGQAILDSLQDCGENHSLALFAKLWHESEPAMRLEEAFTNKDGLMQVFLMIAPLSSKVYPEKVAKSDEESLTENEKPKEEIITGFEEYNVEAVKDCFAVVSKLSKEAIAYLNSEKGEPLLKSLTQKPKGHSLWLFANNWRSAEPFMSSTKLKEDERLAEWQKLFGEKPGKAINKLLSENTSDKKLEGYAKDSIKSGIGSFISQQKSQIDKKAAEDPSFTKPMADQAKKELEYIEAICKGIGEDVGLSPLTWVFNRASKVVTNPDILQGLALFLINPTSVQTIPGAENSKTPAELIFDKALLPQKIQKAKLPFGKENSKLKGDFTIKIDPFTVGDVLSGKVTPSLSRLNSASNKLTLQGGKDKSWKLETANEYTFPKIDLSGSTQSQLLKGKTGVEFKNNTSGETIAGNIDYEFKPDGYTIGASEKISDKKGSLTLSEGFTKNQNIEKKTLGVAVKNDLFRQSFSLNLPKNAPETTNVALGADLFKKKISIDSNVILPLAGEAYIQELASYLEYKDPKDLLYMAAGFQRSLNNQIQKEDFAFALKKTWSELVKETPQEPIKDGSKDTPKAELEKPKKEISLYSGTSFSMSNGKPDRLNALVGTEFKLNSKSKYGYFTEVGYKLNDFSSDNGIFTWTLGLTYDKWQVGGYLSNDSSDKIGVKAALKFDASAWIKKKS